MNDDRRPLALLVNPTSGGGRAIGLMPRVERVLDAARLDFRVEVTRSADHALEIARQAADAGEIPVVVSGDGLIGAVGGALAGSETPLGIVPGGRGNDLARVLGIPENPEAAARLLISRPLRRIDVGEANGRRFLCIASTGFDSEANRIANEARLFRGRAVYAYAALRALIGWKPAGFRLSFAGQTVEFDGYSVAVANSSAYGGGMYVAPDACPGDGEFDIVTVAKTGKLRFLASLPKVFSGKHVENREVSVYRASEVELTADRPFRLYADGEYLSDLPARLRILPAALAVIAPPKGGAS